MFTSVFAFSNTAFAATNSTINFQSRILLANGALVPDGNYHVEFKIYNTVSAGATAQGVCSGSCLWLETRTGGNLVRVINGYVSVNLGSVAAFPATMPWDQDLYVTMRIGGNGGAAVWDATEMTNAISGRMKMSAAPYAFRAAQAFNVLTDNTSTTSTSSNGITIASGNATGATSNSGNISINVGSATGTKGSILIGDGATIPASITLGQTGVVTTVGGAFTITGGTNFGAYYRDASGNLASTLAGTTGQCLVATTGNVPTWGSCSGSGGLVQVPATNAANTIAPTLASVVGLTVNGTTNATGAPALIVNQSNAVADGGVINLTNTSGTQTSGLTINRSTAGGTTTSLLNLVNTAGTATNGLSLTGSFTNLINSPTFAVSGAGALSGITGYAQTSGNFAITGTGTFGTGTGAVSLNGSTSVTGTNTFAVGTGATTLGGTLGVTGAATFTTSVSSPLHTGAGAVTLSSGGATILTIDAGGAAAIGIGQTNASAVNIGKAGITTTIAGNTSLSTLDGAGLADCKSVNSKLLYDATLKRFLCGNDRGSNIIRKTAAESVSSANTGITLQPDNHMFFPVGANETWFVVVSGSETGANAGGMKAGMNLPAGSINCTYNLGDNYNAASNTATSATCVNTISAFIAAASWFTSDNFSYSGVFTTGATAGTATFQWAQNTANATNLTLPIDAYMTAYKLTGADLAEVYYTSDPSVTAGDVVSISGNGVSQVKKSSVAYESNTIGIVSTKPGQVVGENDGTGYTALVGLSGRVPVKVTNENGVIIPGDYLTASTTPGKAMKATRAGQIIGQALTGYSASEDGQVVAFIKNSYFDGKRADVQLVLDSVQVSGQQQPAVASNIPAATSSCIAAQTCTFLSIGSGSVVADSSDNASVAINKKSANGRLLVLQRDGKDVFAVGNDGGLVISASSTSALEIASADQSIFRVDTVGKVVKIGDSGVATPVLFVLSATDTKADPAGQNGASYYNNSAGKFRCYENGQWRNCLGTNSSEYSIVASPVDWSNVPTLATELGATDQNRAIVDLSVAREFRIITTIQHAGNIDCRVQSSTDGLLWADISLPVNVVSLSKIGLDKSEWLPINTSSQKESTLRMMCTAPDNNQSVMLNSVKLQIR